MLGTKEEIEAYINPKLNENVSFNCNEVRMLRHRGNKKLKVFRLDFTWDSEGAAMSFSRRTMASDVPSVVDDYLEMVNRISSIVHN